MDAAESPVEFDGAGFGRYALSMWKPIGACITAAVVLSAGVSLLLPKRYTATASLIIELPAGSDPRVAAALSPVYLESLKTYERFASSDTIFVEALNRIGIRSRLPGRSIESLKRSILRISKPANTRLLEISATLDNAATAEHLARYIAERTVDLNRSLETRSAREAMSDAETVSRTASARLDRANSERDEFSRKYQLEALVEAIENENQLRFDLNRDLQGSRSGLREFEARAAAGAYEAEDIAGARARIADLEQQDAVLAKRIANDSVMIEELKTRREELDAEQKAARTEAEAAKTRLNEALASIAYQGERISVLDPGIVPEQPSYPNVLLNIAVALVMSVAGSFLWISWTFGSKRPEFARRRQIEAEERTYTLWH